MYGVGKDDNSMPDNLRNKKLTNLNWFFLENNIQDVMVSFKHATYHERYMQESGAEVPNAPL